MQISLEKQKEIVLKKDFKDYQTYGSFLYSIFEINNLQIYIDKKERKLFEEFFDIN